MNNCGFWLAKTSNFIHLILSEQQTAMLEFREYDAGKHRDEIRAEIQFDLEPLGMSRNDISMQFHLTDGGSNVAIQYESRSSKVTKH